jgi:hypothetical protein
MTLTELQLQYPDDIFVLSNSVEHHKLMDENYKHLENHKTNTGWYVRFKMPDFTTMLSNLSEQELEALHKVIQVEINKRNR